MKRFKSILAVAVFSVIFTSLSAFSFTPPNGNCVGASTSGTAWICTEAIAAANNDPVVAVMIGPDNWYSASLSGRCYVANCGSKLIAGEVITLCFQTKSGKYIPFCLQARFKFTGAEVISNGIGGENIRLKVSP
ncbi:MAG: hypothetical protein WC415_00925 [Patescibacteria group bacterium]|jgi:hypothetical protein